MTQVLELSNRDFNAYIIKMFWKKNNAYIIRANTHKMNGKVENVRKYIENKRKTKWKFRTKYIIKFFKFTG